MASRSELTGDLRNLGVRAGDLVMVHASLRAVGPVDGGADGVIDAILAAVGPHGTMLMTMGADDAEPFDAQATPVDPDVGTLAEVFRQRPETVVSDHPEGRMGAAGRLAETLTADVPWDDYYGPGSPLERFVDHLGRVLRLGADLDTVTLLHYAEYLVDLPAKRRVRREVVLAGDGEPEPGAVECLDDSDGIVDYPGDDYFEVILREYLASGRAVQGRVGGARSELIAGGDLVPFAVAWMAEHLAPYSVSAG